MIINNLKTLQTAPTQNKSNAMNEKYAQISDGTVYTTILDQILNRTPYQELADEGGMITYNGVTYHSDPTTNSLNLGDVSNPKKVLSIPLAEGGTLNVNVDSFDDLSRSIGMFSAEDQGRIMRAMATYKKVKSVELEIEDEKRKPLM